MCRRLVVYRHYHGHAPQRYLLMRIRGHQLSSTTIETEVAPRGGDHATRVHTAAALVAVTGRVSKKHIGSAEDKEGDIAVESRSAGVLHKLRVKHNLFRVIVDCWKTIHTGLFRVNMKFK